MDRLRENTYSKPSKEGYTVTHRGASLTHRNKGNQAMQTLTPWTIKHLYESLERDLAQCTTQLERDCCKALGGKEIREKAQQWAKERKLTPMEVAIAQRFGFKG